MHSWKKQNKKKYPIFKICPYQIDTNNTKLKSSEIASKLNFSKPILFEYLWSQKKEGNPIVYKKKGFCEQNINIWTIV